MIAKPLQQLFVLVLLAALGAGAGACKSRKHAAGSEFGPDCATEFDRGKYPEAYQQCQACVTQHRGMGSMEADCKNVIAKPWK